MIHKQEEVTPLLGAPIIFRPVDLLSLFSLFMVVCLPHAPTHAQTYTTQHQHHKHTALTHTHIHTALTTHTYTLHSQHTHTHTHTHHQCKLQVMTVMSVSYIFALVDDKKNTTSASCRGSIPSWALVGAGCSNQWYIFIICTLNSKHAAKGAPSRLTMASGTELCRTLPIAEGNNTPIPLFHSIDLSKLMVRALKSVAGQPRRLHSRI